MDQQEWDKLGFNPRKDGKWPTYEEVVKRMKENRSQERKNKIITASIILGGLCILLTVLWLFL
jgi:hypothetical protein